MATGGSFPPTRYSSPLPIREHIPMLEVDGEGLLDVRAK